MKRTFYPELTGKRPCGALLSRKTMVRDVLPCDKLINDSVHFKFNQRGNVRFRRTNTRCTLIGASMEADHHRRNGRPFGHVHVRCNCETAKNSAVSDDFLAASTAPLCFALFCYDELAASYLRYHMDMEC